MNLNIFPTEKKQIGKFFSDLKIIEWQKKKN